MSRKEKNEQRHKMAVAIFREMTPENRLAFVAENQKKHKMMCLNRKAKQEYHREMLKKGREFLLKNNALTFFGQIGGYLLAAGALLQTLKGERDNEGSVRVAYKVAYTLCSHKDTPSTRTASGYIGWRLMDAQQHPYVFHINLAKSGALIPERVAQLIRLHIELGIVTRTVSVPGRLQRFVLRGKGNCSLFPSRYVPKTSQKKLREVTKVSYV